MHRLICLDESGVKDNMTRLCGRAPIGERCVDYCPNARWKTTTLLSSIRPNGQTVCMYYRGGTTKVIFETYVEKLLAPTLKEGDIVIMDNLSSHKGPRVKELIEARGATLMYLPQYSPDLNPIEKMWSKIKAILRKMKARTSEQLDTAIAAALSSVTAEDAKGWFHSCGYVS